MKILIITYSREVNPGTFLQAFGIQYIFRKLYPKAQIDLIKHKRLYTLFGQIKENSKQQERKKWKAFIKEKLVAIPRRLKYEYGYKHYFHLTDKEFDFFNYDKKVFKRFAESYNLVVVGSDTILVNLKKNGQYGLMWLNDIHTCKILFAASAAPANFEMSATDEDVLNKSFATFKLLGVRDILTYRLLSEKLRLGEKVFVQSDPTYLIPDKYFTLPCFVKEKLQHISRRKKIVLVNFGDTFSHKEELTLYLKHKGYYTVSTLYNKNADYNLMTCSPFEWAAMFQYLDFTVTERFHDSVFTLRNNKPVIAVDWTASRFDKNGGSKTSDLLNTYGCISMHCTFKIDCDYKLIIDKIDNITKIFNIDVVKQKNKEIKEDNEVLVNQIRVNT